MSFEAKSLNDILADALFQCDDCKGRGKRQYAVWPKRELKVEHAAEVINEGSIRRLSAADSRVPHVRPLQRYRPLSIGNTNASRD